MTLRSQAYYSGSRLSRFLHRRLPSLSDVVDDWNEIVRAQPPVFVPTGTPDDVGWALELRIGLDLTERPCRMQELSHLPMDRCADVLTAAGFEHRPVGDLPSSGTTDPVLLHWVRASRTEVIDEAQRRALECCLDLAEFHQSIHKRSARRSVDARRSWLVDAVIEDRERLGRDPASLEALTHCWTVYLQHGRTALSDFGQAVAIAPELGDGFGIADMVLGRTIIDVKLVREPTQQDVTAWLRQLLGYVLLDHHNLFQLDTIAIYCGWHGTTLTASMLSLLANATPGPTPTLQALRDEIHHECSDDLRYFARERERKQQLTHYS